MTLLFEIDPRPYQAQYDQANGQVILNQARLKEAQADNARAKSLANTPGAISKQDLDRYQAAEEEAAASLQAAKASLEVFKLNLSFCNVTSPIDGQVSRYFLTPGNLVNQDQTQLTTVVSLDPMYVYFDMDEVTLRVHSPSRATRERSSRTTRGNSRSKSDCRTKSVSRIREPSTSSTIRSIRPRAALPVRGVDQEPATEE